MGNNSSSEKPKNCIASFDKYFVSNDEIEHCYGGKIIGNTYFGMINYKNKNSYYGHWKIIKDQVVLDGSNGVMTFNDGTVYDGSWEAGKYHGHGRMDLYTKASYEGEWSNGKRHGKGIMIYEDGTVINDEWVNGICKKRIKDHYHDYDPNLY